jgi:hypothetical protein
MRLTILVLRVVQFVFGDFVFSKPFPRTRFPFYENLDFLMVPKYY